MKETIKAATHWLVDVFMNLGVKKCGPHLEWMCGCLCSGHCSFPAFRGPAL